MQKRTLFTALFALSIGCSPAASDVSVQFRAVVGDRPFSCGQSYTGISGQTIQPADFRLYVQDLTLLDASGTETPVELDPDGKWQSGSVALLDFEDQTGDCTGTTEVNTRVRGRIAGDVSSFSGLRFTVGVPFQKNHQDQASAPSPLNLSGMFWSWQSGYKFVRIEGKTESGRSYLLHLGSTGCNKDAEGQVISCASPNRATVKLDRFDATRSTVVLDLAMLLQTADLSADAECHSQSDNPACGSYFRALGLAVNGQAAAQSAFRVE